MRDSNYWVRKLNSSRLSRRRFVASSAAAGIGAAGLGLVGCGDDDDDDTQPAATATSTSEGGAASPTAEPTPTTGGPQPGGVVRISSANNTWDTFDADRSRFTPFAAILGRTNLGIVHYRSFERAELEGAFAESWEQPDAQTLTLKLRQGLKWHNKPPVNGRLATVEDMAYHIERNKAGKLLDGTDDPNFYRKAEYALASTIDIVDDETLRLTFDSPNPFFLTTLAGPYAKVQAREAVEAFEDRYADLSADLIIGTGAYILTEFVADGEYRFVRNPDFYEQQYLDGLQAFALFTDQAAQQSAFEQKQIDVFAPRTVDTLNDLLARYENQIYVTRTFSANPMAGTYYGGAPPWSNENLIGAIFKTIDRRLLIQQLFQGSGAMSGNIPPTQQAFGIPESELITFEGYLEDRNKDLTEAKAMWEAGGGPDLGTITVDIPDIWEGAFQGVSESITGMLQSNLGNTFEAKIEPYSTITTKIIAQEYGNGKNNIWYGWISDVNKLEPTLDLFQIYNSTAPQFFQFGVKIDKVDELTAKAIVELDSEVRKQYDQEVMRELLRHWGAGIPYNMIQINNALRWNYYHIVESPPFVSTHNMYRNEWFDMTDPTWQGRPA